MWVRLRDCLGKMGFFGQVALMCGLISWLVLKGLELKVEGTPGDKGEGWTLCFSACPFLERRGKGGGGLPLLLPIRGKTAGLGCVLPLSKGRGRLGRPV